MLQLWVRRAPGAAAGKVPQVPRLQVPPAVLRGSLGGRWVDFTTLRLALVPLNEETHHARTHSFLPLR